MDSNEINRLVRIYEQLNSLSAMGGGAILRRSLAIVASEINEAMGKNTIPLCRDRDEPRVSASNEGVNLIENPVESLSSFSAYREMRSEDRRRTITLDPSEIITGQLIDFYTGRTDVLEFRMPKGIAEEVISDSVERAKQYIRESSYLVSTIGVAAENEAEVADCLRSLAYMLERRGKSELFEKARSLGRFKSLAREVCNHIGTEAGPTRWTNNGTKLEQHFRDVFQCVNEDACCGNQAHTKHGDWEWRLVWEDVGAPTSPPPTTPPQFERYPWENKCAVFPSPVAAIVTSDWGWRTIGGILNFHAGMDIGVIAGTQVLAAADGEIVHVNRDSPNGQTGVIVRTGDEIRQYWHIVPGDEISTGKKIKSGAPLGVTASIAAPHLHFARYLPPDGNWKNKSNGNSLSPCP